MAILRDSKAVGQIGGGNAEVQQSRGRALKQPDVGKFTKGVSTADVLLDSVVKVGSKLAGQAWEAQKEEAYLSGVRQFSKLESEADLQASPFMKDWATSGFRDTKGRLAQADFSAELPAAIQQALSKPDPQAAFDEWLAQAQAKLTDQYSGMSRKARTAMFAQNATDLHAAQRSFTSEYAAHTIRQQERALQADFTGRRSRLDASKNDAKAYAAESQAFAGAVYTNVWLNDRLPAENKAAMTQEAILYAASTGNTQVYQLLKNQQYDFPDGTSGTVMQQLPMEDQIKLDKAYRKAMDDAKTVRATEWATQKAMLESEMTDPEGAGPSLSWPEYQEFLAVGVDNGFITSPSAYEAAVEKYFVSSRRGGNSNELTQMALAGDWGSIFQAGADDSDVVKAVYASTKGQPWENTAQSMLTVCRNGSGGACSAYGSLIAPSITTLGFSEEIDPGTAAMAHQFIQGISEAEKTNPGARVHMLKGLPTEAQDMVLMMRDIMEVQKVADPMTAVVMARKRVQENNLPVIQQMRSANAATDSKAVQAVDEKQLWETLKWGVAGVVSGDAAAKSAITPGRFWFENKDRVAHNAANSKLVLAEAYDRVNRSSPFLSDSARQSKALAMTANQQVPTDSGPVFFPFGHSAQSYFGGPNIATPEDYGRALDGIVELEKGQRIAWEGNAFSEGAKLIYQVYDADGNPGPAGMLDPKDVGVKVQENMQKEALEASYQIGPGKVVRHGRAKVQYNGENTAGFQPSSMLLLRDDLVKFEGIINKAGPDGKVVTGNKSFGVGISQTGKYFEEPAFPTGTYSQEQIDRTFIAASNDAAEQAGKVMSSIGVSGTEWLRFFGDVAYQSPASARNKDMLARIQIGDVEGAIEAFKKTNAYIHAGKERQEARIKRLRKAMQ